MDVVSTLCFVSFIAVPFPGPCFPSFHRVEEEGEASREPRPRASVPPPVPWEALRLAVTAVVGVVAFPARARQCLHYYCCCCSWWAVAVPRPPDWQRFPHGSRPDRGPVAPVVPPRVPVRTCGGFGILPPRSEQDSGACQRQERFQRWIGRRGGWPSTGARRIGAACFPFHWDEFRSKRNEMKWIQSNQTNEMNEIKSIDARGKKESSISYYKIKQPEWYNDLLVFVT